MKNSAQFGVYHFAVAVAGFFGSVALASAAPTIFNNSESAEPGDLISVEGDSFYGGTTGSTSPQLWCHLVTATDTSTLTPDVQVTTLSTTDKAITAQLPKKMQMGLYAVWVKDSNGVFSALPKFINRARATGFEYSEVPAGYTFRIFGRNLCLSGQTPIVTFTTGGVTTPAATIVTTPIYNSVLNTYSSNDSTVLQITAPSGPTGLQAGSVYTVNVTNGYAHSSTGVNDVTTCEQTLAAVGGDGWDAYQLKVPWAYEYETMMSAGHTLDVTAAPYNADKTGAANAVNAIQQAIYDAAALSGGGTVYLPTGTYLINNAGENTTFTGHPGTITQPAYTELVVPSNVIIRGDPTSGATIINDTTSGMPYPDRAMAEQANVESYIGLLNLTYQQSPAIVTVAPPIITIGGSKSFYANLVLAFSHSNPPNAFGGEFEVGFSTTHDVVIENVNLNYGGFATQTGNNNSNFIIRNNVFNHHGNYKLTRMLVGGVQNLVFENNYCSRDSAWPGSHTSQGAYNQGQLECNAASYVNILNNWFLAITPPLDGSDNAGETINSEGEIVGTTDAGTVTSSTTTSMTDSARNWPNDGLNTQVISLTVPSVVPETGAITSNTTRTITIGTTWTTPLPSNEYTYKVMDTSGTVLYSGTVTSSTSNSITDSTKTFATGLTGSVQVTPPITQKQIVAATSATTLTIATPWNPTLFGTCKYSVSRSDYDYGTVAGGATSTTMTGISASGSSNPYWMTGATSFATNFVAIVGGTGAGQMRTIASNTTNSLTITQPWDVIPQTDSRYALCGGFANHYLIKGNEFDDQPRGISLYSGSHDCAVVENAFKNTGQTIYLRANQRSVNTDNLNSWYGFISPSWDDVVTDNETMNISGDWPSMIGVSSNPNVLPYGMLALNNDIRRNIIYSKYANMARDGGSSLYEGYSALDYIHTFSSTNNATYPAVLNTVFDDNQSINTATGTNALYPIYLNQDSNLTAFRNHLISGAFTQTPLPYAENYPVESTGHSVDTTWLLDSILQASFNDSGTGTGGASDIVDWGGSGSLYTGAGADSASIINTTTFSATSGKYLECVIGAAGGTSGHVAITPTSERTSWGNIFDNRTGNWMVNGSVDFFWRPLATITNSNAMRPIDINNGTNGIRLIMANTGGGLTFQIVTSTGGGGVGLTSSAMTFMGGTIYHIAMTFSTNPSTLVTTEKMYLVTYTGTGTGSINTASTGTTPIGTTTFTLSPTVTNNTSGYLSNGPWNFGDFYGNGLQTTTNDYDGLSLYNQIPGILPGL